MKPSSTQCSHYIFIWIYWRSEEGDWRWIYVCRSVSSWSVRASNNQFNMWMSSRVPFYSIYIYVNIKYCLHLWYRVLYIVYMRCVFLCVCRRRSCHGYCLPDRENTLKQSSFVHRRSPTIYSKHVIRLVEVLWSDIIDSATNNPIDHATSEHFRIGSANQVRSRCRLIAPPSERGCPAQSRISGCASSNVWGGLEVPHWLCCDIPFGQMLYCVALCVMYAKCNYTMWALCIGLCGNARLSYISCVRMCAISDEWQRVVGLVHTHWYNISILYR